MAASSHPDRYRDQGDRAGAAAPQAPAPAIKFALPVAPSTNNAWSNLKGRGRVRSKRYRRWLAQADRWYLVQKLGQLPQLSPPFRCVIEVPKVKGDLDNRIKLVMDYLVSRNITPDDRHCTELVIKRAQQCDNMCWIELYEVAP